MVYQKNSRQDTLIKKNGKFIDESEQTVIASIKTMGANIEHSARNNFRPYLMLYGEISAVAFPNGRYQTFYPPTQTHVRYEFSDEELGQLATKGLFYDGFKCPEIISDNPNVEIPMTAIAQRYLLMDNLYVILDLASADIYKTDTKQCGYVFADYFETQIPSKLETQQVEQEEDVIPTFDDDFAAQFAAEFQDVGFDASFDNSSDDFAKEAAQAEHQQSLISAEAQRLLQNSPTAQRQKDMATKKDRAFGKKPAKPVLTKDSDTVQPNMQPNTEPHFGELLDEDDEFAAFRRAQAEFSKMVPPSDPDHPFSDMEETDKTIKKQAVEEGKTVDEVKEDKVRERAARSDASVNINVADNDGQTAEDDDTFGDAFGGELDAFFDKEIEEDIVNNEGKENANEKQTPSSMTKEEVEEALKSSTSTKHNQNPQKLVTPEDGPAFTDGDFSMV